MSVHLLAFDTSTEQLAVALHTAAGPLTHLGAGGAPASAALLPQIEAMLARAGLRLADLDAIAFGRGPGAFTGLRTSCAVAQGLALGVGCPLLAIDSLLIVAEDARAQAGLAGAEFEVGVVMDARMDEVYAGRYRWSGAGVQGAHWQLVQPAALYTLAAFAAAWGAAPPRCWAGSALAAFGPRLALPPGRLALPTQHDRAGALLRLAVWAHADGAGVDAAQALPLYLRDKVALTTSERTAARPTTSERTATRPTTSEHAAAHPTTSERTAARSVPKAEP